VVDVAKVLREWDVLPVAVERPASGTMSDIFIVESVDDRFVLRGHRERNRIAVEFEHTAMATARASGIPTPNTVKTPADETSVFVSDRWWSLLTWIPGSQPPRGTHSAEQALAMGVELARVHEALQQVKPPDLLPTTDLTHEETLNRISDILRSIDAHPAPGADEDVARQWLNGQRDWLLSTDSQNPSPSPHMQVVHGDFHDANVLFEGDAVVGILDWERARRACPVEELIRATHLSFRLSAPHTAAFVSGYRRIRAVTASEIDAAAGRYGFARDRSVWLFDELYRGSNERLRPLINRSAFEPFSTVWERVRAEL
jgi:homoserine kinase type II